MKNGFIVFVVLFLIIAAGCQQENGAPIIHEFSVQPSTIHLGQQARAVVDATDPEGDPLFYEWSASSGCTVQAQADGMAIIQCSFVGHAIIAVTVRDDHGNNTEASAFLTIRR